MIAGSLLLLFAAGLIFAALHDVATMTIPNWVSIAFVLVFPFAGLFAGQPLTGIGLHLLTGLAGLVICIVLFSFGVFGGGDAKLLPAVLVWIGPSAWLPYIYGVALAGGGLAILVILTRRFVPHHVVPGFLQRSVVEGPGIPYAVAIGVGVLWAFPHAPLLQALHQLSGVGY